MLEIIVLLMMIISIIMEIYEHRQIPIEEQNLKSKKEHDILQILDKFINEEITEEQKENEIKKIKKAYKEELKKQRLLRSLKDYII